MKWAAGIFVAILFLVWPYYTLLELAQAVRAGDAPTISRLVDWDRVRTSVKSQVQAHFEALPKTGAESSIAGRNLGGGAGGNAFTLALANTMVDKMLTSEGIARLAQIRRAMSTPVRSTRRSRVNESSRKPRRYSRLWRRIKFAFFVSPIHFRFDLSASGRTGTSDRAALTVMLMFKGTGWQVSDMRLPQPSSRMALSAQNPRSHRAAVPVR